MSKVTKHKKVCREEIAEARKNEEIYTATVHYLDNAIVQYLNKTAVLPNKPQRCIECNEPVGEDEFIRNCHGHCRIEV